MKSNIYDDSLSNLVDEFCASPIFLLYLSFALFGAILRFLKTILSD